MNDDRSLQASDAPQVTTEAKEAAISEEGVNSPAAAKLAENNSLSETLPQLEAEDPRKLTYTDAEEILKWALEQYQQEKFQLLESVCTKYCNLAPVNICDPVAGYPMQIVSCYDGPAISKLSLTVCGENMLNTAAQEDAYKFGLHFTPESSGIVTVTGKCFESGNRRFSPFGGRTVELPDSDYMVGYTVLSGNFPGMGKGCCYSHRDKTVYLECNLEPIEYRAQLGIYVYPKSCALSRFAAFTGHTYYADFGGHSLASGTYRWTSISRNKNGYVASTALDSRADIFPMDGRTTIFCSRGDTYVSCLLSPKAELKNCYDRILNLESSNKEIRQALTNIILAAQQRGALPTRPKGEVQDVAGFKIIVGPADKQAERRAFAKTMLFKKDYDIF